MFKIEINENQRNNPVIKDFKFAFSYKKDLKCDFKPKENIECFYLSFKCHLFNPQYISNKLKNLSKNNYSGITRYLICFLDVIVKNDEKEKEDKISEILNNEKTNIFIPNKKKENLNESIIETELININLLCEENDVLLLLSFSSKEVSQYIHSLSLLGNQNTNYISKNKLTKPNDDLIETLCCIDTINKNDAKKLFLEYKNIYQILINNGNKENEKKILDDQKNKSIKEFLNFEFNNFNNKEIN